jgi:hypothetical protein
MARNLTDTRLKKLQWLEARTAAWSTAGGDIGLSDDQTSQLATQVTAARAAFNAAELQRAQSKAATGTWHEAIDEAAEFGAALVNTIKAFARATSDPGVYSTAMVSPSDPPVPSGAPDEPTNVRTQVLNTGAVEIAWDGTLANRTFYEVFRRIPGQSAEVLIASIGKTKFADETVPAGHGKVWYSVRARRGDLASDATDVVEVRLGVPTEGGEGLSLAA